MTSPVEPQEVGEQCRRKEERRHIVCFLAFQQKLWKCPLQSVMVCFPCTGEEAVSPGQEFGFH
jgi:hypothetical protein